MERINHLKSDSSHIERSIKLGLESEMDQVINHLIRQSTLGRLNAAKISLNLSCFWEDFRSKTDGPDADWFSTGVFGFKGA